MKSIYKNIQFYISVLLILHHFLKHKNDTEKSLFNKFFQIEDINNHETWILFFFGLVIGMKLT
jgi:hypothetical protein